MVALWPERYFLHGRVIAEITDFMADYGRTNSFYGRVVAEITDFMVGLSPELQFLRTRVIVGLAVFMVAFYLIIYKQLRTLYGISNRQMYIIFFI